MRDFGSDCISSWSLLIFYFEQVLVIKIKECCLCLNLKGFRSIITNTRRLKQRLWALKSFITNCDNLVIRQCILVSHTRGPDVVFSRTITQRLFDIPDSLQLSCRNNTMSIIQMVRGVIYLKVALILLTVITLSSGNWYLFPIRSVISLTLSSSAIETIQ